MNTLDQLRSGALAGSRRLTLNCGLSEFPAEIFDLADSLEILDLSGNALSALPDDLPRLERLRIIFCANNRFTELPEVLGRCAQLEMVGFKANRIRTVSGRALPQRLRWLILTDNEIEQLPPGLGRCDRLQKLALAGNRLRTLPPEMAACTRLELLRISANVLDALPDWLLSLPRLSWLAFGGNPFSEAREQAVLTPESGGASLRAMPWSSLRLQQQLGEGASGVIHRAEHRPDAEQLPQPVALKVFKGQVTSDGWPASEMATSIAAGAHPNLIPVLGRLIEHPAQAEGLVMALIAPEFRSLAGPPSLVSCSRDVYAAQTRFTPAALLQLASGIAAAVAHLHRQGITHGDLYGHNILHDGHGQAYLGDFGAASFVPEPGSPEALALQQVEARAFGCLLEELLERCDAPADPVLLETLVELREACLGEVPASRPLFAELAQTLHGLIEQQARMAATSA